MDGNKIFDDWLHMTNVSCFSKQNKNDKHLAGYNLSFLACTDPLLGVKAKISTRWVLRDERRYRSPLERVGEMSRGLIVCSCNGVRVSITDKFLTSLVIYYEQINNCDINDGPLADHCGTIGIADSGPWTCPEPWRLGWSGGRRRKYGRNCDRPLPW